MSNSLRAWKDKAVEITLRTMASKPQVINPAWRIDPAELKDVTIRWPIKYEWERAHLWVDTLLYGFRRFKEVEMAELEQPYRGTVLFQFVVRGKAHDVAIDYSDYSEINEESALRCPIYFKMQHLREGYGLDHVLPGGYVPDGRRVYLHLPRLRKLRDSREFDYDVYGRFSVEFAGETRRRAVELLSSQKDFKFEGGLDREHIVYAKDDFSDLTELCNFYLENEEAREAMCIKSRGFFEQYLHKDNLTAYYIRSCLDRLRN